VTAVHRYVLDADDSGQISAGYLHPDTYRPFPPGAAVVLDAGAGWWMTADTAATIARALAHVRHISVTGTDSGDRSEPGLYDGTLYGLEAIAAAVRAVHARDARTPSREGM
jgi:hypothetical protein